MINQSTIDLLKEMRFSAMASELENQINNPKTYANMGFEERVGLMVDAEWSRRQSNKLTRYIRNARFAFSSATIEGIEYYEDRKLDKAMIMRLSSCKYIDDQHHIILKGATGAGKTYIACALGNAACRKFKNVRYIRMPELLDELIIAKAENNFPKVINYYKKIDLLILDEWLIRKLTAQEAEIVLELAEARSQYGATIFCTQYDEEGWYSRINADFEDGEGPMVEAIMDRFTHNSYTISIQGQKSMRERYGLRNMPK